MSAGAGDETFLEGHISVLAALESNSRPVHGIFIRADKRDGDTRRLLAAASASEVGVTRLSAEEIGEMAQGNSHGGVLARVGARATAGLLDLLPQPPRSPFIAMIDGVEDPYNFGQAVRALYAAGADGLVVRPRNWMSASGVVARASAGATERIPLAIAESASAAAEVYRQRGIRIACTALENSTPVHQLDLRAPLFLLIGGEKRGITRSFREEADLLINIPYGRTFDRSLGTTAAAAVLGFEVLRQRSQ